MRLRDFNSINGQFIHFILGSNVLSNILTGSVEARGHGAGLARLNTSQQPKSDVALPGAR